MKNRMLLLALIMSLAAFQAAAQPGKLTDAKQAALAWLDAQEDQLWSVSKYIWDHPEVGLAEFESSEAIVALLQRHAFKVDRGVAGMPTAFVATWGSGKPVIGVLGEYDALPGLSQKAGVGEESPVEAGAPGHGCGHSIFGVASAGAALGMKAAMEARNISGTVKFFGCPAEETLIGKVYMARDGVFDGLDACLSWHPSSENQAKSSGSLALNNFAVSFYGRTAHAAGGPWSGRSALDAVELLNYAVNMMREHVKPTVRIHYSIPNGGVAPNVVPGYARVWYYVRDLDRRGVEHVYQRVMKAVEAAAMATETTSKVEFLTGCNEMNTNAVVLKALHENFVMIGPPRWTEEDHAIARQIQKGVGSEPKGMPDKIEDYREPQRKSSGGGSTDVAEVSWICPLAEINVASSAPGAPGHHWATVACVGTSLGRKAMITAAKVMGATGLDLMTQPELLSEAWKEFDRVTEGKKYQSPLPPDQPPPKELPH